MSGRQHSGRDKRVSKLTKESEKLRQEITELEDALILHSRFQAEDDSSLRGMIRKEVGGSRWEHGGQGKLHTYRGNQDLTERSGYDKRRCVKENSSLSHKKEVESYRAPNSSSRSHIKQDDRAVPNNKNGGKTLDKTCLNGEWAIKSEKLTKKIHQDSNKGEKAAKKMPQDSNKGELSEIDALKNKVLAKASAKVIKRKEFSPVSENKSRHLQSDDRLSNKNYERNKHSIESEESKEKKESGKNEQNNDISYSLSFLESLQETEVQESNLPNNFLIRDESNRQVETKLNSQFPNEIDREMQDGILKDNILSHRNDNIKRDKTNKITNAKGSKSHRWATERDKVSKDSKEQEYPRTQRRNSVGGTCDNNVKDDSRVVSKNRMSQPEYNMEKNSGKQDKSSKSGTNDFPLLFGSVHKTLDFHSQTSGGNVHVSLIDEKSDHILGNDSLIGGESPRSDHIKSIPSTKQSIIICDEEVQSWLENLGLQDIDSYVTLFSDHEMDMSSIRLLTAGRLREMGIHALGPIMKIMKGVQVLNRDSSLREDVENVLDDSTGRSENKISSDVEDLSKGELNPKDRNQHKMDNKVQSEESVRRSFKNEKSPISCPSSLSWKKTEDEAEYVNLNDRSPIEEEKVPQAVSIKEKSKKSDKEKKSSGSSMSGPRKTRSTAKTEGNVKDENQSSSKVVRKPPLKKKDGISSAQEKYLEKKKQEELKIQSDQITSARQRQLRDKMAARHTSRRSSSLERKRSPRKGQQVSLNRTFSESQNEKDEIIPPPGLPQSVEELLQTKPLGVSETSEESSQDQKFDTGGLDEEATVMELLDTKNLDQAMEKLADPANSSAKESLNLSIVRQLKQQLYHIEQHLVQKMEQPDGDGENVTERGQEEISRHKTNVNRDSNVRTSARERRRQRTPKQQFSSALEGNSDIAQEFFKVGGITSHRQMRDDESIIAENKGDTRTSTKTENDNLVSPLVSASRITEREGNLEQRASQHVTENNLRRKEGWHGAEINEDRGQENIEAQILDNIHINKISRQTEMSRGKLAMAQEYLRKIEIDKKDISFEMKDLLGDGAFSQVYRGIYQGSEVAIKQLKTSLTSNDKNYFSAEVSLLQELRHPHVVMLLGVCTAYTCPVLVLEYLQGGNLHTRIHDTHLPMFPKEEFSQISRDIASGICYLHNHRPPVLHLDLKSRNVLLGLGNRAKVADFGFSKWKVESDIRVSRSSKSKLSQGSPAWMAPELLSAGDITPKADVYSFAIVLWEMLAREDPYGGCSTFQILDRVRTCQRPSIPLECPTELKTLIERCWEQNPCIRPTFKDILLDLDKISSRKDWLRSCQEMSHDPKHNQVKKSQESLAVNNLKGDVNNSNIGSIPISFSNDLDVEDQKAQFDDQLRRSRNDMSNRGSGDFESKDFSEEEGVVDGQSDARNRVLTHDDEKGIIKNLVDMESVDIDEPVTSSSQFVSSSVSVHEAERRIPKVNSPNSMAVDQKNNHEADLRNNDTISQNNTRPSPGVFALSPRTPQHEKVKLSVEAFSSSPRQSQNERIKLSSRQSFEDSARVAKGFDINSTFSPRTSQQEKANSSSTQMLIDSAQDTQKLDELLHKYLPSPRPRDNTKKEITISGAGDASRKLLPLRQSLVKPKKPPKPWIAGRMPMSQSENFACAHDVDTSLFDKEIEDMRSTKKIETNVHCTPSESSLDNISKNKKSGHDAKKGEIASLDQEIGKTSNRSQKIKSPSINTSQHYERFGDSLQNLDILGDEPKDFSFDENVSDKNLQVSSSTSSLSSKNFSDVTKEIEYTLTSLQNMMTPPSSSSQSTLTNDINNTMSVQKSYHEPESDPDTSIKESNIKSSITENDFNSSITESNNNASIENQTNWPDQSHGAAGSTQITKLNLDEPVEYRSSLSTDMSIDSLSLSLSEDEDSLDFSRGNLGNVAHKRGKSKVNKSTSVLPVKKMNRNAMFSSSINNDSVTRTKSQGKVRESFFLFNDFHLDLNKLSDYDSEPDDYVPVSSLSKSGKTTKKNNRHFQTKDSNSQPPRLSPTVKLHKNKNSQILEHHQHSKKSSHKQGSDGEYSKTTSQYLPNTKTNSALLESIHRAKEHNTRDASDHIPPPPPPFFTSHQIKKSTRDHSNPVRSGVPIKSASSKPEVRDQSRFSVEPGLLLQQRNKLKSVLPPELSPLKETSHGRSMPSVASILKRAMDERRMAMGDNQESQEGMTTPDASWSIQD